MIIYSEEFPLLEQLLFLFVVLLHVYLFAGHEFVDPVLLVKVSLVYFFGGPALYCFEGSLYALREDGLVGT